MESSEGHLELGLHPCDVHDAATRGLSRDVMEQSGLPYPCLTTEHQDRALTATCAVQESVQLTSLSSSAPEGGTGRAGHLYTLEPVTGHGNTLVSASTLPPQTDGMNSFSPESADGSPGRVALVTGATRGVGAATVRLLAIRGYSVIVNYAHDQELADQVVDSILGQGGAALAVRADVGDNVDVERLFAETVEWCGGVDVVVHAVVCAPPGGPLAELSVDQIDAWIQVEARARLLVNREAARYVRDGGAIVNLSSAPNGRTVPGSTARKASVADAESLTKSLTKSLAAELRDRLVSVNAIALDLDGACDPDPVAGIVAYLASDEGRRHTGQFMTVGQWLRDPRSKGDSPQR